MRRLVIGSVALDNLVPATRVPKDLDVFADHPEFGAEVFWHPSFESWLPESTDRIATLDELYTIKVSHSYWDLGFGSWEKHVNDIATMKRHGAVLDVGLHDLLYPVWEKKHGRKVVNLNQDKEQFFSDAVRRVYDHDSIHESVAYGDRPLYEAVIADGETVKMSMRKVWALPFDDQVRLFREEVFATALERWVIPSDYRISPAVAYRRALKKTIVSLTKGRSARFMVENYDVFRRPDVDYVRHHLDNSNKLIRLENAA